MATSGSSLKTGAVEVAGEEAVKEDSLQEAAAADAVVMRGCVAVHPLGHLGCAAFAGDGGETVVIGHEDGHLSLWTPDLVLKQVLANSSASANTMRSWLATMGCCVDAAEAPPHDGAKYKPIQGVPEPGPEWEKAGVPLPFLDTNGGQVPYQADAMTYLLAQQRSKAAADRPNEVHDVFYFHRDPPESLGGNSGPYGPLLLVAARTVFVYAWDEERQELLLHPSSDAFGASGDGDGDSDGDGGGAAAAAGASGLLDPIAQDEWHPGHRRGFGDRSRLLELPGMQRPLLVLQKYRAMAVRATQDALFVAGDNSAVVMLNWNGDELRQSCKTDGGVRSLALDAMGESLFWCNDGGHVGFWNFGEGKKHGGVDRDLGRIHRDYNRNVFPNHALDVAVVASDDSFLSFWDYSTQQQTRDPVKAHNEWTTGMVANDTTIVTGGRDGDIRIFNWDGDCIWKRSGIEGDVTGGRVFKAETVQASTYALALSPDGVTFVSGGRDDGLRVWGPPRTRTKAARA